MASQGARSDIQTKPDYNVGNTAIPLVELTDLASNNKEAKKPKTSNPILNDDDFEDTDEITEAPAIIFPWQARVGFIVLF